MRNILLYGSLALVPLLALGMAKGSRGAGRQFALARLTNTDSVEDTIDRQVRLAGRLGLVAIVFVVAVLVLFFFAPSEGGTWVQFIASLISFAANLALGLASGIGLNAALILAKVGERDTIEAQIQMKRRTRRRLGKFLSVLVALLVGLGSAAPARAGQRARVWAIDVTDSVDPAQRNAAIEAMIAGALETARAFRIDSIVVVKVANEDILSDMTWVPIPPAPNFEDCNNAIPEFHVSKSWVGMSPTALIYRKRAAVAACLARQKEGRARVAEQEAQFLERLRGATKVVPRADVSTRIVPPLQTLLRRPYVAAVELVTDLQDQSGMSPDRLDIPSGKAVTVVVTRPNPKRSTPTLRDVLAASERWARIKGVTVINVAEYPGYVHLAEAR